MLNIIKMKVLEREPNVAAGKKVPSLKAKKHIEKEKVIDEDHLSIPPPVSEVYIYYFFIYIYL